MIKKPSPTLAYEAVYGKSPKDKYRRGRPPFQVKEKIWNGIEVDYSLKNRWLENLNNIPNVEIRGTCAGHSEDWVSFVVFRITDDEILKKVTRIVKELSSYKNTYSKYDIGMEGRIRIVCATNLYDGCENQKDWENWWNMLPYIINKAINKS
jgi:hypothetical protein